MLPQRNGCLEQGQADRGKAAATTEARLVDLEDAPDRSRARDLTMFNLAIDSKLRGSNLAHERPLRARTGRSLIHHHGLGALQPYANDCVTSCCNCMDRSRITGATRQWRRRCAVQQVA
jgi:hypothetical protein